MKITFDPDKNARNIVERNLTFERASELDWEDATLIADERNPNPEPRFVAVGYLDLRLHGLCFTPIPSGIRVISFRKANEREARRYGKEITKIPD